MLKNGRLARLQSSTSPMAVPPSKKKLRQDTPASSPEIVSPKEPKPFQWGKTTWETNFATSSTAQASAKPSYSGRPACFDMIPQRYYQASYVEPTPSTSAQLTREQLDQELEQYHSRGKGQEREEPSQPQEMKGKFIEIGGCIRPVYFLKNQCGEVPNVNLQKIESANKAMTVIIVAPSAVFGFIRGQNLNHENVFKNGFKLKTFVTPYKKGEENDKTLRAIELTGRKIDIICATFMIFETLLQHTSEWRSEMTTLTKNLLDENPLIPREVTQMLTMNPGEAKPVSHKYCHFCWMATHQTTSCPYKDT